VVERSPAKESPTSETAVEIDVAPR